MPASTSPVVLILGAGANIGANVARAFATKGYKVALAARKLKDETNEDGQLTISSDFADPSSFATTFAKVREALGEPSVVVYNGTSKNPPGHSNFQESAWISADTQLSRDQLPRPLQTLQTTHSACP